MQHVNDYCARAKHLPVFRSQLITFPTLHRQTHVHTLTAHRPNSIRLPSTQSRQTDRVEQSTQQSVTSPSNKCNLSFSEWVYRKLIKFIHYAESNIFYWKRAFFLGTHFGGIVVGFFFAAIFLEKCDYLFFCCCHLLVWNFIREIYCMLSERMERVIARGKSHATN